MIKISILLICSIFCSYFTFAFDVEQIFKEMHKNYAFGKTYSTDLSYTLYKGHDSNNIAEKYDGVVINTIYGQYQRMDRVEYISTKEFAIQLNNNQKYIAYSFPVKRVFTEDLKKALTSASRTNLTKTATSYVLTLYYSGFTSSPFSKVKITINTDDFLLETVDMYFINDKNFAPTSSGNDFAKPHLRINYSNYSKKPITIKKTFELGTYLQNENGILFPSPKYKGYELIDQRI